MGRQRFLPFYSRLHLFHILFENDLIMSDGKVGGHWLWKCHLHGRSSGGTWQGRPSGEHLEQVDSTVNSRLIPDLANLHSCLFICCTQYWFRLVPRTREPHPADVHVTSALRTVSDPATGMLGARLCVEVHEEDVLSANISSRARDSKVQRAGLSTTDGAVPKGGQEGAASAAYEKTARICI